MVAVIEAVVITLVGSTGRSLKAIWHQVLCHHPRDSSWARILDAQRTSSAPHPKSSSSADIFSLAQWPPCGRPHQPGPIFTVQLIFTHY